MAPLLEDRPIAAIRAYFAAKGMKLTVHMSPPDRPSADLMRRLPRLVRRAIETNTSTHWAALDGISRHYGGGSSDEDAIRNAARRYRIEQAPEDGGPD